MDAVRCRSAVAEEIVVSVKLDENLSKIHQNLGSATAVKHTFLSNFLFCDGNCPVAVKVVQGLKFRK